MAESVSDFGGGVLAEFDARGIWAGPVYDYADATTTARVRTMVRPYPPGGTTTGADGA